MVDMGMRQNHRINKASIERDVAVALECLLSASLIETAVQQQAVFAHLDQMHGTGDGSSGAPKTEFHGSIPFG